MSKSRRSALAVALLSISLCGCFITSQQKEARHLSSGKKYYAARDYDRAILEFKNAIRMAPRDAEAYYQLGLAHTSNGDLVSALACFTKATELNPKHTDAQLKAAALLLTSPSEVHAEEAQKRVKGVLAASPASSDALYMLAFSELRLRKEDDAVAHLQQTLNKFPADLSSSVLLTRIKVSHGDIAGAEGILKNCVDKAPRSPQAARALGTLYVLTKKFDLAQQQFRRALQVNPKYGPALMDLGMLQFQRGSKQEAEQTFKQLSALPDKIYKPVHALFLMETGQRDAAVQEFERLSAADPSDRDARTRLVAGYLSTGRSEDAGKLLSKALKANPKDVDALVQRATVFVRAGKYTEAENDLSQVLRFRPEMAEAHATMAAVHEARGATLRQREELGEALRLAPGLLPVRLNLARLLIGSKAPAAALDILDAKETYPSQKQTVPYIVQRNWALLALGRREELRKGIDQGLAAARTPDLLVQDALLQSQEKNYAGAKSALNEALNQDPEYLPALEALMRVYAVQKKVPEAIENIRVYVAKRPNSALLQEILGNLLAATGKPGEARSAYMQAQAVAPRDANPILALANLDLSERKFDSARERLDKVQTLYPKNPQVWLRRGLLEVNQKNSPRAIDSFRKVLEVDPKNVLALNNLAYLLATQPNQANDALQYAQQAKELSPDLPDIDDTLGWVLYNKAVYQSALSYLENALKKHNDPAIRYHLAMTYTKLGDKRGPQMLRETLKVAPDLPEAAMAQRMLAETPRNSK